ncbi:hypothetical protein R3Q06_32285 [Rhodococcus erythropolis]|uniref:hypothetical protein n=1 Tax=Rhodococcus erythropolis TaxID=1833 RepID=UPI002948C92F|nr:hypothetical protein [Rhodococcus erythropolis]MDV6278152.1 hypothetical protein [Rhodococcus erythropolis]
MAANAAHPSVDSLGRALVAAESTCACPICGHEPATRAEDLHQRADFDITWIELDKLDRVATGRHCRSCQPTGPTLDISCAVWGDSPILTATLASEPATVISHRSALAHQRRLAYQPDALVSDDA